MDEVIVKVIILSMLMFNWSFFQPELPTGVEKIDLKLTENEIAFTFLDLIDGESTLIQTAKGENILLNTGSSHAEEELFYYLDVYGVDSFSYVILTGSETEYIGNLQRLLKNFQVGKVIVPNSLKGLDINNDRLIWNKGNQTQLVEDLGSQVLSEQISSSNKSSMDLLFEYNGTYLLYMTTANEEVEKTLMKENDLNVVNILKVADFGNQKGTSQEFLTECDPQVAIMFKKAKAFGMMDVLERLHETWIDIYQTRQVGNITIKLKDNDYQVITLKTMDSFQQD